MGSTGNKSKYSTDTVLDSTTTVQNGDTTITLDEPLIYGKVSGNLPQSLYDFETKRQTAKVEHGIFTSFDGKVLEENRGGRGSVKMSVYNGNRADIFSHNHPRGKGEEYQIGGTFSTADITNFTDRHTTIYRAVGSEGVYHIQKGANFNKQLSKDFAKFDRSVTKAAKAQVSQLEKDYKDYVNKLSADVYSHKITIQTASSLNNKAFKKFQLDASKVANKCFISLHNWLIENQSNYGYSYALERRD